MSPRRKLLRLKNYDYSQAGAYFVTVCVHQKHCLLGTVVTGKMQLSDLGCLIDVQWRALTDRFPSVVLDEFIIMPNHVHGIIVFKNVGAPLVGAQNELAPRAGTRPAPTRPKERHGLESVGESGNSEPGIQKKFPAKVFKGATGFSPWGPTLGDVMGAFKSITAHQYLQGIEDNQWPSFPPKLWQRNYYEHVIRNENELYETRKYIQENPMKWELDPENPERLVQTL